MSIPEYTTGTSYTPDNLVAKNDTVTREVTLADDVTYARGTVLGMITSTGVYTLSLTASSDGSEVPRAVLARAVSSYDDATERALVYVAGTLKAEELTYGTGHDFDSCLEPFNDVGIYLASDDRPAII